MNPLEETGKVVGGVVDGLKSQPMALAMIVLNVLFLGALLWIVHEIATTRRLEREAQANLWRELQVTCQHCRENIGPRP